MYLVSTTHLRVSNSERKIVLRARVCVCARVRVRAQRICIYLKYL